MKSVAEGVNAPAPDAGFTKRAKPFYLDWQVPHEEQFEKLLEMAQENFGELRSSVTSNLIDFRVFGSEWIKSTGVSPDAFAQLCFQLAHYRMVGQVGSTYESVNMKKYLLGRTETGRPLTSQAKAFVEVMGDILSSPEQKIAALRTAAAAHVQQIADCQKGNGVDRHLWALNRLSQHRQQRLNNYSPPALFSHESYSKVREIILSTSTCSIPGTAAFGFGPVSPAGFGLGYGVFPNHIMVFVTSFVENGPDRANLLAYNIQKAFRDCYALLESAKKRQ
jgi:carnitine O-acetyltransferase